LKQTHVAVLGPGGVGGLVAAALDRAGTPVTVVAREETAAVIERDGLRVRSTRLGDFTARPRVVPILSWPVDLLIVATKATTLQLALERVLGPRPEIVLPLLNGLEHLGFLRARFGAERVLPGVIRVESDRPAPGLVVHTSPFLRVDLAPDERAEGVAHLLRAAEIPTRVGDSEAEILWRKLVRLNALACTTTAHDAPLGEIRTRPDWRAELTGAVEEGAAVARAEGAPIEAGDVLDELWEAHEGLTSSMQRDVRAGREPELDAIAGAVLRAGERHGIACPTIAALAEAIRARTASR
jgi:2-dehydropantoate 2-reductase